MEREQKVAQANEQFEAARDRGETPRSTPLILGILALQRPWQATDDCWTHEGIEGPLVGVSRKKMNCLRPIRQQTGTRFERQ